MSWKAVPDRLVRHVVTTVPTFDDDPNVTHPSVVRVPGGWNGYEYWMFFTPFPGPTREDPSIAVSNDGVTWRKLVDDNRVFTYAQAVALGFQWNSDTHLIKVGDELWGYHRPANDSTKEAVYLHKSSDGVTWSAAQLVLLSENASAGAWILSPAIEQVGGTFHMWHVSAEGGTSPRRIEHRTSATGESFGASTICTLPAFVNPWHLEVKVVDGTFYMLANGDVMPGTVQGKRLYWLTSADGDTWTGDDTPVLHLTGDLDVDARHYRSCMWPMGDGRWEMWVAGIPNTDLGGPPWRLIYHRNAQP